MKHLKELSERARVCTNESWRNELKERHVALDKAIDAFWRDPSADNLRLVNAEWVRADRVFKQTPPDADPLPPLSGAPEAAQLAA